MPRGPYEHDSLTFAPDRQLECRGYGKCLDVALSSGWVSWCCTGCTKFVELTAEEKTSDMIALLHILGELEFPLGIKKRHDP
jgi:hypothetical protein